MSAASVRPRSAGDCLIRSAVDISHSRQQGTPPASSSAISGSVRSDIIIGFGTGTVGGGGNPSLVSSMPPGVVHGPDDSVSAPPSSDADVRANAAVVDGHADVRASAVTPDDNDDGANVGTLDDLLSEILGASSRVATPLDLDLAFGAVDVTDGLACTPLSPLPPPIASPPSSAAAGEPI